ncbi:hypothetical protein PQ689_05905 [Thermoanaerobacterium thermosaccharolyticum]|uniref:hypothetical protein n=1 Tax=Thermoanaerobacterium TaxID=28895 RepID=UPI00287FE6DB|nr:hypothetical protein [Thermoanaerobacterium sp. CMT5567-10]WKV08790.2 hypothetical protein Q2T46_14905 [Thermoanaerobacterium sp. CMT5567-10]
MMIVILLTLQLFIVPTRKVGKSRWKMDIETQSKFAKLTNIITEILNISEILLIKLLQRKKKN